MLLVALRQSHREIVSTIRLCMTHGKSTGYGRLVTVPRLSFGLKRPYCLRKPLLYSTPSLLLAGNALFYGTLEISAWFIEHVFSVTQARQNSCAIVVCLSSWGTVPGVMERRLRSRCESRWGIALLECWSNCHRSWRRIQCWRQGGRESNYIPPSQSWYKHYSILPCFTSGGYWCCQPKCSIPIGWWSSLAWMLLLRKRTSGDRLLICAKIELTWIWEINHLNFD